MAILINENILNEDSLSRLPTSLESWEVGFKLLLIMGEMLLDFFPALKLPIIFLRVVFAFYLAHKFFNYIPFRETSILEFYAFMVACNCTITLGVLC